jgi:hypothetical protein
MGRQPGSISNVSIMGGSLADAQLGPMMKEGLDYEIISEPEWVLLKSWYVLVGVLFQDVNRAKEKLTSLR